MGSETARLPVLGIVVGYVQLSLLAFIYGRPTLDALQVWDNAITNLGVHAALGPLAVISYAPRGWGYSSSHLDGSIHGPAIIFYLTATLLLVTALALASRRARFVRWVGYVLAAVGWVGTGFLMAVVRATG